LCGIAGIYDVSGGPVEAGTVAAMTCTIAHRGPDSDGVYTSGHVGLGFRRLAIIDLSEAGSQPMANEDGSVVIVFNGEIYNFQKLRTELKAKGHTFRSLTDTEVIIHGYEEWGEAVVGRLNGMFAFAIYDGRTDSVFMARDRYGIKPLYYTFDGDRFIFGSEIKAVLVAYPWDYSVDRSALIEYFTFQNVFSDRTLFSGVRLLPAGHTAFVRRGSATLDATRFWDFSVGDGDGTVTAPDFAEATEELRRQVEHAVVRHLISDVPLGSYLSGGMDSGSLVALATRSIPHMMTFTGGFDVSLAQGIEMNFDEREAAESMASLFHTDHYEMVMHGGSMQRVLPRLIWHLEDLRVGMSYQNYYIAHLASKFVRVVLSGGGGDEMFAGYPWRYLPLLSTGSWDEFLRASYGSWERLVPASDHAAFFTPEVLAGATHADPFDAFAEVFAPLGEPDGWSPLQALDREMYFEGKTFLHGLLVVEDKISSAHALEARVPFLDNDLVDFVTSLPAPYKLNISGLMGTGEGLPDGSALQSSDGKHILRAAMSGLVPDSILGKKKQGFSTPDASWYRGESMAYIREVLLSSRALGRGYFEPEYVTRVVDEHAEGKRNHRLLIWSLLSFEWWNRVFVDREQDLF
jgi:asparagine synthase (glutamine-hydrolysing)